MHSRIVFPAPCSPGGFRDAMAWPDAFTLSRFLGMGHGLAWMDGYPRGGPLDCRMDDGMATVCNHVWDPRGEPDSRNAMGNVRPLAGGADVVLSSPLGLATLRVPAGWAAGRDGVRHRCGMRHLSWGS